MSLINRGRKKKCIISVKRHLSLIDAEVNMLKGRDVYVCLYFIFQQSYMHTQNIKGGIEVDFKEYVHDILRVKVLNGYHLVPRDYPSMTSDPYYTVKLSPTSFLQTVMNSTVKIGDLLLLCFSEESLKSFVFLHCLSLFSQNKIYFISELILKWRCVIP